jgi:hypothetical protein
LKVQHGASWSAVLVGKWWGEITRRYARAGERRDDSLTDVKAISAHVQNGTIVPDEPIEPAPRASAS